MDSSVIKVIDSNYIEVPQQTWCEGGSATLSQTHC